MFFSLHLQRNITRSWIYFESRIKHIELSLSMHQAVKVNLVSKIEACLKTTNKAGSYFMIVSWSKMSLYTLLQQGKKPRRPDAADYRTCYYSETQKEAFFYGNTKQTLRCPFRSGRYCGVNFHRSLKVWL